MPEISALKLNEFDFGYLEYYDNFIIGKINPNVKVNKEVAKKILKDINNFYNDKKIIYISDRSENHDVDPSVYKHINVKQMVGIAIVSNNEEGLTQAKREQKLYDGAFGFFNTIKEAIAWANTFVNRS